MPHSWNDPETQDLWSLSTDESALLPGMTDKGRLGFAIQLKFMQLHGRFPERHDEIDPSGAQWLAVPLGTTADTLSAYELTGRQGQRHRRILEAGKKRSVKIRRYEFNHRRHVAHIKLHLGLLRK